MKKRKYAQIFIFLSLFLTLIFLAIGVLYFAPLIKLDKQYPISVQSRQIKFDRNRGDAETAKITPSFTQVIKITGYLGAWIDDDFKNRKSQTVYTLSTEGGQHFLLNFKNTISVDTELSGAKVDIMARRIQNRSEENLDVENLMVLERPSTIKTIGNHSYIGVLVNFSNNPEEAITPDQANTITQEKVRSYYEQVSFGKVSSLSGSFDGWYTYPAVSAPIACTYPPNLALRTIASIDDHVDFRTIDHLIIVALDLPCSWAGKASFGTVPFVSDDGLVKNVALSYIKYDASFPFETIVHELGHNFGLGHSSSYDGDADPCFNRDCAVDEYGHQFDTMGDGWGGQGHFNALHLERLGWLDQSNIVNLVNETENVTVRELTINNLEDTQNGLVLAKLLKAYNNDNIPVWYGLDVRSAKFFDQFLGDAFFLENSNFLRGIEINLGTTVPKKKTYWIDLQPARPARIDKLMGALEPNQSIRTPEGHLIEVLSRGDSSARVKFTIPPLNYLKADISYPKYSDLDIDSNTLTIKGTAGGSHFNSFRLSYATGLFPQTWQSIISSAQPIKDGDLAQWNISNQATNVYSLKLEVVDSSGLTAEQITSFRMQKPSAINLFEKVPFSSYIDVQDISNGRGVFRSDKNPGTVYIIDLNSQRLQELRGPLKNIHVMRIENSFIALLEKNADNATYSLWSCDYNNQANTCRNGFQELVKSGPTNEFLDIQNNWIIYSTLKNNTDKYVLAADNIVTREHLEFSPEVSSPSLHKTAFVGAGESDQGRLIVWKEENNSNGFFAYNLDLKETGFISVNGVRAGHDPRISNGRLAWILEEEGQNYSSIYLCAINWTDKICQPSRQPADQSSQKSELIFSNQWLGWTSDDYYTNPDLALLNIEEGKQLFGSVRLLDDRNPIIEGNFIGWNGAYPGFSFQQNGFFTILQE